MKTSKLIARLLAMLGFGAAAVGCEGLLMYGSPYSEFDLNGRVTDEAGSPVRDIKIVLKPDADSEHEMGVAISDANGVFRIYLEHDGGRRSGVAVIAEDIDGDKNGGEFAPQTLEIEIEPSEYKGGDGDWDDGRVTKTAEFTLTLKSQGDENE